MRTTTTLAALVGSVAAQAGFCPEAARFGLTTASPTTLSSGQVSTFVCPPAPVTFSLTHTLQDVHNQVELYVLVHAVRHQADLRRLLRTQRREQQRARAASADRAPDERVADHDLPGHGSCSLYLSLDDHGLTLGLQLPSYYWFPNASYSLQTILTYPVAGNDGKSVFVTGSPGDVFLSITPNVS
jgi:hypothetical protein